MNKNFLIVGHGNMGKRYADLLREIYPDSNIFVKLKEVSYGEMRYRSFDAAFICTPSDQHISTAIDILDEIGPVPMLIEKPVTNIPYSEYDLGRLMESSIRHQIAIYIAYNLRHTSIMREISKTLSVWTDVLRPIAVCRTDASKWPGKRKLDSANVELSHEIDYLLYLFGPADDIVDITIDDGKKCMVKVLHSGGMVSRALLDMDSPVEERYISLHPHFYNRGLFHITREDISLSYYSQIGYFLRNRHNPLIDNNISDALIVTDEI